MVCDFVLLCRFTLATLLQMVRDSPRQSEQTFHRKKPRQPSIFQNIVAASRQSAADFMAVF